MINYKKLKTLYAKNSSWAIWDELDITNTKVIEDNEKYLHSRFIIVGLNVSANIQFEDDWANFHRGRYDDRLRTAFNKHSYIKGAFMTDLLENTIQSDSSQLTSLLKDKVFIEENSIAFKKK